MIEKAVIGLFERKNDGVHIAAGARRLPMMRQSAESLSDAAGVARLPRLDRRSLRWRGPIRSVLLPNPQVCTAAGQKQQRCQDLVCVPPQSMTQPFASNSNAACCPEFRESSGCWAGEAYCLPSLRFASGTQPPSCPCVSQSSQLSQPSGPSCLSPTTSSAPLVKEIGLGYSLVWPQMTRHSWVSMCVSCRLHRH